ncbi:MAG: YbjN domain-containing protein [Cellulomonas sp.]|nr:YbjN domain-containing protein [Cellulomonas sp.]
MGWSYRLRRWWSERDFRTPDGPRPGSHQADVPASSTTLTGPTVSDHVDVAPLSDDRLVQWLTDSSFSYFVDNDGDVGGLWRGRVFYFFLFGQQREILQVRGHWQREGAIERLIEVLEFCNRWNTERIWPKAYVRVRDDGHVHVVGEVAVDFEHGATDDQLSQTLHCGLATGTMLFDALDEQYPDPVSQAP